MMKGERMKLILLMMKGKIIMERLDEGLSVGGGGLGAGECGRWRAWCCW